MTMRSRSSSLSACAHRRAKFFLMRPLPGDLRQPCERWPCPRRHPRQHQPACLHWLHRRRKNLNLQPVGVSQGRAPRRSPQKRQLSLNPLRQLRPERQQRRLVAARAKRASPSRAAQRLRHRHHRPRGPQDAQVPDPRACWPWQLPIVSQKRLLQHPQHLCLRQEPGQVCAVLVAAVPAV